MTREGATEPTSDLVHVDPDIMGGEPVFRGSRVPIYIVLGSLEEGMAFKELQAAYAFLTQAHVDAARAFASTYVPPGRPKREPPAGGKLVWRRTIAPLKRD